MDELYVLARGVLLDVLEVFGAHRDAIVLVGAQAIYLRVGEGDLAVAPFTTDADLAINPEILAEIPAIEKLLLEAKFERKAEDIIGVWIAKRKTPQNPLVEVPIDLLVPKSVSPGRGRRAARLPGHDPNAARIVAGLEGVLVDSDLIQISALEVEDSREFEIQVAGPAALLVAKLHKVQDRQESTRHSDKDALDIYRLLRGTETEELSKRYQKVLSDKRSGKVAEAALEILKENFTGRNAAGVQMIIRAMGALGDPDETTAACEILVGDFLKVI